MGNTRVIEIGTAYSVLQPMFEKVVRCINSSQDLDQLKASERYACNFLNLIESKSQLGELGVGYSRTVLSRYYGQAIRETLINHSLFKLSVQTET